jgi:hypothetical protein
MKLSDLPPGENFLEPGQESHASKRARLWAENDARNRREYQNSIQGASDEIRVSDYRTLLNYVLENLNVLVDPCGDGSGDFEPHIYEAVIRRHKELKEMDIWVESADGYDGENDDQ